MSSNCSVCGAVSFQMGGIRASCDLCFWSACPNIVTSLSHTCDAAIVGSGQFASAKDVGIKGTHGSWGSRVASDTINDDETSQSGVELWALAKHRSSENSIQLCFPRYASLRNDLLVEHGREAPEPSQPLRRPGKAQERNKA